MELKIFFLNKDMTWRWKKKVDMGRERESDAKRKRVEVLERGIEKVGVTSEFSLEFYNYFMPLDLQSIINYLFGLT